MRKSTEKKLKENSIMLEISDNQKLTLIEVRAEWSGGSHLMDFIVNRVEEQFDTQLRVLRIDFETHREFLYQFGVESAPAILLMKQGQVVEVINETLSQKNLEEIIHNHLLNSRVLN